MLRGSKTLFTTSGRREVGVAIELRIRVVPAEKLDCAGTYMTIPLKSRALSECQSALMLASRQLRHEKFAYPAMQRRTSRSNHFVIGL